MGGGGGGEFEYVDYPFAIALAFLFSCCYLGARIFATLRLPGPVGIICVGFLFRQFMHEDIHNSRDELQELAFFLVLLTAGFEITLPDLNVSVLLMAWLPVLFEMMGLMLVAVLHFKYTWVQAGVLACSLSAIGDGLVIPKMKAFTADFPGHTMPRLLFTWAPLEASLVLTIFGVLTPLAHPEGQTSSSELAAIGGNLVIIIATCVGGVILGFMCAKFVEQRTKIVVRNRCVFTGSTVEAYLIVLATALFAFGCGQVSHKGVPFVPLMISEGSLFQPELFVIVMGSSFGACVHQEVLHGIEAVCGGVWVFGQLMLFFMLGTKTDLNAFGIFLDVIPLIVSGLIFRFVGVFSGMSLVAKRLNRPKEAFYPDVVFCFVSTLPRATLQGALAGLPKRQGFFADDGPQGVAARDFMAIVGRLYIVCFAVCGSILVDTVGRTMLEKTEDAPPETSIEDWKESELSKRRRTFGSMADDSLVTSAIMGGLSQLDIALASHQMGLAHSEAASDAVRSQAISACTSEQRGRVKTDFSNSGEGIDMATLQRQDAQG